MSTVPEIGTYVSENKGFKFRIQSANPSNGVIKAVYETDYSPEGPFSAEGNIGRYSWVFNDQMGKDGVPPFSISIFAITRPDKRPYCIYDMWAGCYLENNNLLMQGVRSYVNDKGVTQTMSLGTLTFYKK